MPEIFVRTGVDPTAIVLVDPEKTTAIPQAKPSAISLEIEAQREPLGQTLISESKNICYNTLPPRDCHILARLSTQGMKQRLKRGHIYDAILLESQQVLLLTSGGVGLLDLTSNQVLWEIDCPSQWGRLCADKSILALGNFSHIFIWDMQTKAFLRQLEEGTNGWHSVALSPDGNVLAAGKEKIVSLWDVRNGQRIQQLEGHEALVFSVTFSPDGKTLTTGSYSDTMWPWQKKDNSVRLWDVKSGREIRKWETQCSAWDAVFSPDGHFVAMAGDGVVLLWDVRSGKQVERLEGQNGSVMCVTFNPDGRLLVSGSVGEYENLYLWDTVWGREVWRLKAHEISIGSAKFSPDGQFLASVVRDHYGPYFLSDRTVRLWNVEHRQEIGSLGVSRDEVYSVAFSPDGRFLASGGGDPPICLWNIMNGAERRQLGEEQAVYSIAFSPDGYILASAGTMGGISLWDVERGWLGDRMEGETVSSIAFSPDGQTIAFGFSTLALSRPYEVDKTVQMWNIAENRKVRQLKGHRLPVTSVAFSPDGRILASGSGDRTVILWDVASGKRLRQLFGHKGGVTSVAFSPDGQVLASGSGDRMVILWNVASRRKVMELEHKHAVYSVAFSPSGHLLASGIGDGSVCLWDVTSGQRVQLLEGHADVVLSVAFSPNGHTLASGSWDGTVRLWQIK